MPKGELDAETSWCIRSCLNNTTLSVCKVADQWLDFNVERCFVSCGIVLVCGKDNRFISHLEEGAEEGGKS